MGVSKVILQVFVGGSLYRRRITDFTLMCTLMCKDDIFVTIFSLCILTRNNRDVEVNYWGHIKIFIGLTEDLWYGLN